MYITDKNIDDHKSKYKAFDAEGLKEWLNTQNNRHFFKSVAEANNLFRRYKSMDKYSQKM